jgi:hypothetical protein
MTRFHPTLAACAVALAFGTLDAHAAGDKAGYEQSRASAKTAFETDRKGCDALAGNAKDICVAEAKARRTKAEATAEADWKGTPKARESALKASAEADYEVAKERCDDKGGNEKDICRQEAKAAMTKVMADAKAMKKGTEARMDAADDKRDADYKVATQKCESLSGDAKRACVDGAKARYGK